MELINAMSGFNADILFFLYGLLFTGMGLTVLVQPREDSSLRFTGALWLLGGFGLARGTLQYFYMWREIRRPVSGTFDLLEFLVLFLSYLFLFEFGRRTLLALGEENPVYGFRGAEVLRLPLLPVLCGLVFFVALFSAYFIETASLLLRWFIGFPGAFLAGIGLLGYSRAREATLTRLKARAYFIAAGVGFLGYAVFAGLIPPKSHIYPANRFNTELFFTVLGVPIQAVRAVFVLLISGGVIGTLRIFREGALQAAQQELLDIIEFFPDATFVIDRNKKVIAWNRALEIMTGVPKAKMLGKGNFDYAVPFYGDRRPLLIDLIGSEHPEDEKLYEYVSKRPDGAIYAEVFVPSLYGGSGAHVWVTASPLQDKDGNVYGAIESVRDVTDRKLAQEALYQSEERYRTLVNNAQVGIVVHKQGVMKFVNNKMRELVRASDAGELLGRNVLEFIHPEYKEFVAGRIGESLKNRTPLPPAEEKLVAVDGAVLDVEIKTAPIAYGGEPCVMAIVQDITARKLADRQLLEVNAELEKRVKDRTSQLEEVNKELEAFSYSAAHDMKAPLRRVSVFSEMLEKEAGQAFTGPAREYLNSIHKSVKQMTMLVEGLLALSTTGKKPLELVPVRLSDLVNETISDVRAENPGREIEWKLAELPEVRCDRAMLKQAFTNLIGNAAKYSRRSNPARIEVSYCVENQEHIVGIRDNGVGFDMAYADKLFGVFQRLHKSEDFEGTGIGLSTVRRIIGRHGGRVWAESSPGKGAGFYFTLPVSL